MMGFGGFGLGMGMFGGLMMLVFWIALILLVVLAVRALFPAATLSTRESAIEILQRRLAAGEISQAEFEQARKALGA